MDYLHRLFNVENKVTVITGGSGVLGIEMAKGLLKSGSTVIILGTNEQKVKSKEKTLRKINQNAFGLVCNVLDEKNIITVNNLILDKFGSIDILINAAGGHIPGTLVGEGQNVFDLQIQDLKKVTDLNLHGTILPTLIFGKAMAKQKSGSIINISSMAAQRVITRVVGYSVAKAGIENFTKWMSVEMANKFGNGIRVNAIAPGFFLTAQNKNILTTEKGNYTKRARTIIDLTPFKRFGEPYELIGTILWLASDASKFVTGAVIPIDGGFSAFSGV
jgi:NAD(P)-dependent dehydrogenase (short-subunit alcohol dehydrogenase family)